jgi:hypothetical protein
MNADLIIAALALPPETRVDQRVPKKLLVENGAPTAADKRQINEGIEELLWLAALKPTTIGVPEYRDDVREYLEIAVLSLTLRPDARARRLVELIHRAIPYPLLLVAEQSDNLTLSLAHKRWSQGESGKMVLDDAVTLCDLVEHAATAAFLLGRATAISSPGSLSGVDQLFGSLSDRSNYRPVHAVKQQRNGCRPTRGSLGIRSSCASELCPSHASRKGTADQPPRRSKCGNKEAGN